MKFLLMNVRRTVFSKKMLLSLLLAFSCILIGNMVAFNGIYKLEGLSLFFAGSTIRGFSPISLVAAVISAIPIADRVIEDSKNHLTILRIGSIKDWFLVKLVSLIFLSLLLGLFQTVPLFFIGDMGYLFFLHFFVVNSTNFILFSSLLFLLFHFDFSDAVSFCITYSLLVFIIFSGEILGENTNYFVTILARVAEYEKNSNLSLFIAIFFEIILSAAILSFIKIRYSLGGKIHE